jgi:hypothetical protein
MIHKRAILLSLLFLQLLPNRATSQQRHTISGFVYEKGSRETLIGVNVFLANKPIGTVTNGYGFYSLTLPADSVEIIFSFVGYQSHAYKIGLNKNIEINVELEASIELEAVEVRADMPKSSSRSSQMSVIEVPVKQVKALPAFLGEKDVLKVIQLMPGVQKGSEGTSGLYVRGGGPDQNLIILDDATVYNAYHLFGFFSLFNGDAIKSIELTKGGFPARYGGRLSSVVDIIMKDGNKEKISGEAGIGLISSRAVIEGPIVKEKASFLVSGRRTYIDVLTRPFMPSDMDGGYFFYDLTTKANWEINKKNRIYLSGYFGRDKFFAGDKGSSYDFEAGMFWDNSTATLRWNRIVNERLFSNFSVIFSNYRLKIYNKEVEKISNVKKVFELSYRSGIRDYGIKYDFSWHPMPSQTVRFGLLSTWHQFNPSAIVLRDDNTNLFDKSVETINSFESGAYIEDEIKIFEKGIINIGARLSNHILNSGEKKWHIEPRASGSYFLSPVTSVKASFARMNQYLHLLSSTGIGLPTDLWVPATDLAPAQNSWQTALGVTHDLNKYSSTLSIEGYYKKSNSIIAYKPGASFLMFDDPSGAEAIRWEDNVAKGDGESYGVEFFAQRKSGKLSGWVGYTLSWTMHHFEEINFGKPYYARYDRRHDISVVGIYELSKKITMSATWVYGTGNAITLPLATYPMIEDTQWQSSYVGNFEEYGEKNGYRMAPYHRLDFGIQHHRKTARYEVTWELSIYNVYNRHNPYFYYIDTEYHYNYHTGVETKTQKLKQISLFPIIPTVTWSIKF